MNMIALYLEEFGPFQGVVSVETWNGWLCPYFDHAEASRLMQAQLDEGFYTEVRFDEQTDTFIGTQADGVEDTWTAEMFRGEKRYAIGAWAWCWNTTTPEGDAP